MSKEIERLEDLTPDVNNPNRGTERGRYMLEVSLGEVGAGRSIVVDKAGRVIAGNKTLEAWAEMGGEIEVIRTDGRRLVVVQREDLDLDDPAGQARKLSFYDNRTGEVSLDWDVDELFNSLNSGLDLSALFFDDELEELLGNDQSDFDSDAQSQDDSDAPEDFPEYGEDIETEHCCPKCGYKWSGKPA